MKIRSFMKPCGLTAFIVAGLFTCADKQTTAPERVMVVPVISWKTNTRTAVPSGVDSIRISISSSALTSSLVKTFAFNDSQGTIPSVPADIGITVMIEGIDSEGHVIYRGSVTVARVIAPKMEITIEADQVTPIAPSDLIVQALSSGSIRLIWKENSSNESYYLIDRRKSGSTAWDSIGTSTQNLFTDSGMTPVTAYNYRIYAVNAAGKSLEAISGTGTTLFLDTTGPEITIAQYAKKDTANSRTITIYGTVRDTSGVFQVMLNDIVAQLNGNQWIKQNYYLADSINRIIIKATDNSPRKNISLDTLTIVYKSTYIDTTNHPPIFTVISDSLRATVRVGQTYHKLLKGMDPDAQDTIRFTVSSPLSLKGKDTVHWTPAINDTGAKACYALIFDKKQAHDSLAWTIAVIDSTTHVPNHPPAFITAISDLQDSIRQNSQYSDTLIANDADAGQPLAFSIVTGPTGLIIGSSTGIITWTPTSSGVFPVTARVTDDSSARVDLAWTIAVVPATMKLNHPPRFVTQTTDLTASGTIGKPYRDTMTATDQDSGAVLRYSIVNGPVTIDSVSGIIAWTPTTAGNYSITARARDDSGAHADLTWAIAVADTNHAPVIISTISSMNAAAIVGTVYKDTINATDPDGDSISLSLLTKPTNMVLVDSIITWTPAASSIGVNQVIVKASDKRGKSDTLQWSISVIDTNHAPVITSTVSSMSAAAIIGTVYKDTIHATDPDGDTIVLSLMTKPTGMIITDSIITWTPTISSIGANQIAAKANDGKGKSDTLQWTITVVDTNHAPVIISTISSMNAAAIVGTVYKDTIHAMDPDGDAIALSLLTKPAGMINTDSIITWTPTVSNLGANQIAAKASDGKGKSDTLQWMITVADTNHTPVIISTAGSMNDSGTVGTVYKDTIQATDQDAGAILRYSIVNGPVSIDSITGILTWTPAAAGNYSITARARDNVGAHTDITWAITVNNIIKGLLAYYPFNGNTNDESGNGHNGINHGAILIADRFGNAQKCYSYNGIDNYMDFGDFSEFHSTTEYALSLWIKPADNGNDPGFVMTKGDGAAGNTQQTFNIENYNSTIGISVYVEGGSWYGTPEFPLRNNQWHHIVATVKDTMQSLYVDDSLVAEIKINGKIRSCSEPIRLAANGWSIGGPARGFWAGAIDDIHIYNMAIASDKIDSLFKEGGWIGNLPEGMKMISAAGKMFAMGSNAGNINEQPVHIVNFNHDFWIDSTEVTQENYSALMTINPAYFKGDLKRPVEQVTWFDAVLYCNARSKNSGLDTVYSYSSITGAPGNGCSALNALQINISKKGYRLPTEAEWEYACRAGSTTEYYWGDDTTGFGNYVWSDVVNANGTTHPVALKTPNNFNLYDIAGNVWEWCNDFLSSYSGNTLSDPTGPATGTDKIVRGGSWFVGYGDGKDNRSAVRGYNIPEWRNNNCGFRCVLPR